MERISDHDLDKELVSVYSGGRMDQDIVRLALQELKERRAADNKIAENIKKEMVIFCKNFEDRRNHSTICHPPDDEECVMLSFCESMENILEAGSTSKQSLPVEPLNMTVHEWLNIGRKKFPSAYLAIQREGCPGDYGLIDNKKKGLLCTPGCGQRWHDAMEGEQSGCKQ